MSRLRGPIGRSTVGAVLTTMLSACYYTAREPIALPPLPDPLEVQVDGRPVEVHRPVIDLSATGDTIVTGWEIGEGADSTRVTVPFRQAVRRMHGPRSVILAVSLVAAFAVAVAIVPEPAVY